MDLQRLRQINELKADKVIADKKHHDLVMASVNIQETVLKSFKSLVDYLDNRVSKTEVVNQLQEIGTPDSLKVVSAINHLHQTLKTHENTDLTEITSFMRQMVEEAKKIPKNLPTIPETKVVDYSKQFKGLESAIKSVEKVVKAQKLIAEAPIIKNAAPVVHVEKPDLGPLQGNMRDVVKAVNAIVIPKYKTDNKEVEKLLKKSNKLLSEILDKPVGGGGGGGGRATPYQDSDGVPAFVELIQSDDVPEVKAIPVVNPDGSTVGGGGGGTEYTEGDEVPTPIGTVILFKDDTDDNKVKPSTYNQAFPVAVVDFQSTATVSVVSMPDVSVKGTWGHGDPVADPPILVAGYGSDEAPASVTEGDVTQNWNLRSGARVVSDVPLTDRKATSGSYTYYGLAPPGSSTASAVWRVKRGSSTEVLWADGNSEFDNVWDNYLALSYS